MHWSYVNVSELTTTGGSMGAGWDNGRWALSAGGAVTARLDAIAIESDGPWLWTPESRGSLSRQWREQGLTASLFWKYTGQQVNYALVTNVDLVRGTIAPYHMADVTMSKRLLAGCITLSAGCKDLQCAEPERQPGRRCPQCGRHERSHVHRAHGLLAYRVQTGTKERSMRGVVPVLLSVLVVHTGCIRDELAVPAHQAGAAVTHGSYAWNRVMRTSCGMI